MLPRLFKFGHISRCPLSSRRNVGHLSGDLAPLLRQVALAGIPLVQLVHGRTEVGELALQLEEPFSFFCADFLNLSTTHVTFNDVKVKSEKP